MILQIHYDPANPWRQVVQARQILESNTFEAIKVYANPMDLDAAEAIYEWLKVGFEANFTLIDTWSGSPADDDEKGRVTIGRV